MRPRLVSLEERALLSLFGGVEFPQGASSFADEVLFFRPVNTSTSAIATQFLNSAEALGVPDNATTTATSNGEVTLGSGGELGLHFTDNVLTNGASTDNDLWIFE